jgi:hypothetical protein
VSLLKCGRCGKTLFSRSLAADHFLVGRDLDAVPLRPYYDKGCRAWHLTSRPAGRRAA